MKRIIGNIAVLGCLVWGLNAYAWMDDWAPEFKCDRAEVEVLPKRSVSNFVGMVRSEDIETYWQYCEGYRLDLNDDGIKDFLFILPWMGCGLNACGYDAHFKVSAGGKGWTDTVVECYGISTDDLVKVAGKTYFRHSNFFEEFEKSEHNHWVYQVFSFDRNGDVVCANGDFGKLFPAVTIYYINPKFRQIELTAGDLRQIEAETRRVVRRSAALPERP